MKICTKCKEEKPYESFSKKSSAKDGKFPYCKECDRASVALWSKNNKERHYIRTSTWSKENKEACNKRTMEWRKANPEKAKASVANWNNLNKDKVTFYVAKRRATKHNATPSWLTEDDHWLIEEAYDLAKLRTKMFGFVWHVDHIIPLKGKNVCGLHVPINLQVIPASENCSKRNRFEP